MQNTFVSSLRFCLVTYLDFLRARTIQENYSVEFSVSHKLHFL